MSSFSETRHRVEVPQKSITRVLIKLEFDKTLPPTRTCKKIRLFLELEFDDKTRLVPVVIAGAAAAAATRGANSS